MTWDTGTLIAAVFGGSFFGSFLGPVLYDQVKHFLHWLRWKNPRKKLLKARLTKASGEGWVTIEVLSRLIGTSCEDCRDLLIDIKARGGTIKDSKEAWALISRQPLNKDPFEKDETEE